MEKNVPTSEAIKTVIEDATKWSETDWYLRIQWVTNLERLRSRVETGNATWDEIDQFWVKLWGLIDEFEHPLKEFVSPIEDALNPSSKLYQVISNPEIRDEYYGKIKKTLGTEFPKMAIYIQNCLSLLAKIRNRFSETDLLHLFDYRTHVSHPVASYYRLKLKKDGSILSKYGGRDRSDIQKMLKESFEKFHVPGDSNSSVRNFSVAMSKLTTSAELLQLQVELGNVLRVLNPLLL